MGDYTFNPSFYYEIDRTKLVGKTRTVYFGKISKYPDLAKRYKATRPSSVNFIVRAELFDGSTYKTVLFKVTDNNLGYTESRSARNIQSPTFHGNSVMLSANWSLQAADYNTLNTKKKALNRRKRNITFKFRAAN